MLQHLGRHAMARVSDRKYDPRAPRVGGRAATQGIRLTVCADGQRAAAGHGVSRVHGKVQEDLLDLSRLDLYMERVFEHIQHQRYVVAHQAL